MTTEVSTNRAGRQSRIVAILSSRSVHSQSELVALLAAGNTSLEIDFKKGGLCKLEAESLYYGRCAKLVWLLTPRQMEMMT